MNAVEPGVLTVVDVGRTGASSDLRVVDGRVEISGGQPFAGGGEDAFAFAHIQASGDFDLVGRLLDMGSPQVGGGPDDSAALAGLGIRENLEPSARGVLLLVPPIGRPRLAARFEVGGMTRTVAEPYGEVPLPMWLKLERRGPSFNAWASHDGLQWSHFGSTSLELERTLYAGLVLARSSRAESGKAVFSEVHIEELPSG